MRAPQTDLRSPGQGARCARAPAGAWPTRATECGRRARGTVSPPREGPSGSSRGAGVGGGVARPGLGRATQSAPHPPGPGRWTVARAPPLAPARRRDPPPSPSRPCAPARARRRRPRYLQGGSPSWRAARTAEGRTRPSEATFLGEGSPSEGRGSRCRPGRSPRKGAASG